MLSELPLVEWWGSPAHCVFVLPQYTPVVSLTEIKTAVEALSPDELTELAAFIRERDNAAWDRQIDSDFSDGGRLHSVAEEVRADIRAGRLQNLL